MHPLLLTGLLPRPLLSLTLILVLATVGLAPARAAPAGPRVSHHVVESFDGTPLEAVLFLPAAAGPDRPVPLVLRSHGWAGRAQRRVGGTLERLLDAGYGVLTWDQRGFGCSGGVVQLASPEHEARDVSALIDWAVAHAPVQLDGDGDPVVGMSGASYAGGIQLVGAALDPRIDAIAPELSWFDLRRSLYGGRVVNQGWGALLYASGTLTANTGGLDPSCETVQRSGRPQRGGLARWLDAAFVSAVGTNRLRDSSLDRLGRRSPAVYGERHPVRTPTLLVQGTVDTLFDLGEAADLLADLRAAGTPARLVAFCGGHVGCPSSYDPGDDRMRIEHAILRWFDRHLRHRDVDTGPPVEYRTNHGPWRSLDTFPPTDTVSRTADGQASLLVVPSAPSTEVRRALESLRDTGQVPPDTALTTAQVAPAGDARADSLAVTRASEGPLDLVGVPEVRLTVTGRVWGLEDAAHVFLSLVDREAGEVVNLQEAAVRIPDPSDTPRRLVVRLPPVAYTLLPGHHLDLQVSTASTMHATARAVGRIDVEVHATVPVLEPAASG